MDTAIMKQIRTMTTIFLLILAGAGMTWAATPETVVVDEPDNAADGIRDGYRRYYANRTASVCSTKLDKPSSKS